MAVKASSLSLYTLDIFCYLPFILPTRYFSLPNSSSGSVVRGRLAVDHVLREAHTAQE